MIYFIRLLSKNIKREEIPMRTSKIISGALATVMVASTLAIGGVSASAATVKKPTKVKAVNTTSGIKITWKKVNGAKKYKVYRGKKVIKTVKKAKYTDKKAKAGKTYKYAVKAVKGKKTSKASKKVSVTRLKKPTLSSVKATATGIKATWKAVKGAAKYQVFRKSTGKYAKVATVKTKTYTDKKAVSGTKYSYKVKAVKGKSTSVASAAKSATYLAKVTNIKITPQKEASTLTYTWDAVKGATGYTVTDRISGKKVADVTTNSIVIKPETTNITYVSYEIVATKGTVKSAANDLGMLFVPAGSYFTDKADNTVHAKVALKVGEKYEAGSYGNSLKATVTQVSGEDVATEKDFVITANKAGTAQFKVEFDKETQTVVTEYLKAAGYTFQNDLSALVAYVDVTVE